MYGVVCLVTSWLDFCLWQQFNKKHVWSLPEEWVTRFVGRHPVNDKEPNVLPTWWGSPTLHSAREGVVNESFPNRWLVRGGPVAWPPRSPDLTPLDYYLWGHTKTLVYETKSIHKQHCAIIFLQQQNTYATILTTLHLLFSLYWCVPKTA